MVVLADAAKWQRASAIFQGFWFKVSIPVHGIIFDS